MKWNECCCVKQRGNQFEKVNLAAFIQISELEKGKKFFFWKTLFGIPFSTVQYSLEIYDATKHASKMCQVIDF